VLGQQNICEARDSNHAFKSLKGIDMNPRRGDRIIRFHVFAGNEVVLHAAEAANDRFPLLRIHGDRLNAGTVPWRKDQIDSREKVGHISPDQLEPMPPAQQVGLVDFP